MDLPGVPEDDEPTAHPRGPREFELPEQAPGNPGWMRAFAETTAAQREPFADGVERLPALDPVYWQGGSRERFARTRDDLVERWRTVLDLHDDVLRRVEGHSSFVHQLQHLWEADRGNPVALGHTAQVHREAAERLAAVLLERAAQLDAVTLDDLLPAQPAEAAGAAPVALPRPGSDRTAEHRREPEPDPDQEPDPEPDPDPDTEPDPDPDTDPDGSDRDLTTNSHVGEHVPPVPAPPVTPLPDGVQHDVPTTPAHRYQLTEKLGEQLVTGVRQYRILWEGARR